MDSFYPVVSFMAFISGGCFGWYYAWRVTHARPKAVTEPEATALAEAA